MTDTGWEILPLGWLLLIAIGLALITIATQWLRSRPTNDL